jgi:hypothetical protein
MCSHDCDVGDLVERTVLNESAEASSAMRRLSAAVRRCWMVEGQNAALS